MKIRKMEEMYEGWFIGDFEPTVCKTKDFEVCYKIHEQGEVWPVHYHKVAKEINYLIRGKMTIQGTELSTGDIFGNHYFQYEINCGYGLNSTQLIRRYRTLYPETVWVADKSISLRPGERVRNKGSLRR